ncbi:MAG TPA: membrane protein insertase YidC [Phycisphaerae bacterium]|nr:membrane protein insertase YidC [Phycisphaerae bacterium]
MEPQTKRTLIATLVCLLILVGWFQLQTILYPPPQPAPASSAPAIAAGPASPTTMTADVSVPTEPATKTSSGTAGFTTDSKGPVETVTLGDDREDKKSTGFVNPYEMAVVVTTRGAGVESVRLSRHRNHVPKDKKNPDHDPYDLLRAVEDNGRGMPLASFVTERALLVEDKQTVELSDVNWSLQRRDDETGQAVELSTVIKSGGEPVLRLTRTYRLAKGAYHLDLGLTIDNLSREPRSVIITQRGPIGLKNDDPQREFRRIVSAVIEEGGRIVDGETAMRKDVLKAENASKELKLIEGQHTAWSALGSKYFVCIVAPLPAASAQAPYPEYLVKTQGRTYLDLPDPADDLSFEQVLAPPRIAPKQTITLPMQAFCGPKSDSLFERLPEARERAYGIVRHADQSGCTFHVIQVAMLWLLTAAHKVVGNYGVAIIILVLIVRLILHPVTKRGQINMMKMQKGMAQLKPKMEALQEQYKNDKQKLNEEVMKLYREEGINPASQMLGCLPMFLQMPIWVALWTTLNTNVELRHRPFFWWINDLSSPDALYQPSPPWDIHIPLIGAMTGTIHAFNLLPIIMTITMYAQQKFMQKLTKPDKPPPPKLDAEGRPLPDPMVQQQKMMSFMMLFFGLLFYNFPSGLNLYILSSNLLGMLEQYRIKKHIRERDARGEFEIKKKETAALGDGKPSFLERLAKKAEDARLAQSGRKPEKPKKQRKQPRF